MYQIIRSNGNFSKVLKNFDTLQEAMDALYVGAKRFNLKVEVDMSVPAQFGFCLWQIQVLVGNWRYSVYFVNPEFEF